MPDNILYMTEDKVFVAECPDCECDVFYLYYEDPNDSLPSKAVCANDDCEFEQEFEYGIPVELEDDPA